VIRELPFRRPIHHHCSGGYDYGPEVALRIFAKVFWRVILPLILAIALATVRMLDLYGRSARHFGGGPGLYPFPSFAVIFVVIEAAVFLVLVGVSLRNTLKWAKEAEDYEECLREEERTESERRRSSSWITR
jgi:hypothetical protein